MKTLTVSQLKADLGRTIDDVLEGKPCVIVRGNKFAVIQRYELPEAMPAVLARQPGTGRLGKSGQARSALLKLAAEMPPETLKASAKCAEIVSRVRSGKKPPG